MQSFYGARGALLRVFYLFVGGCFLCWCVGMFSTFQNYWLPKSTILLTLLSSIYFLLGWGFHDFGEEDPWFLRHTRHTQQDLRTGMVCGTMFANARWIGIKIAGRTSYEVLKKAGPVKNWSKRGMSEIQPKKLSHISSPNRCQENCEKCKVSEHLCADLWIDLFGKANFLWMICPEWARRQKPGS